jgi:hypothetical protein
MLLFVYKNRSDHSKKNWTIDLKNFLVDLYYEEFALL